MNRINVSKRPALALVGVVVLTVVLFVLFPGLWGGTSQPISFNHKIHADNELACLDCHLYYMDHASSGRPQLETCAACHEESLSENKEQLKVVEAVQKGEEIPWERLYRVPEDVNFSHRRHVVLGKLECEVCHGDIGESTNPPARPLKIKMKKCMKCHEAEKVSNDCISCHR